MEMGAILSHFAPLAGGQANSRPRLHSLLESTPWITCDGLADAHEGLGTRGLAVENYNQSLALNPQNQNAVERLKALRAEGRSNLIPATNF